MTEEKLLTIREVSQILNVSEKEVIELAEAGKIPAYKVGGVYLRFKREQVEWFKNELFKIHPDKKPIVNYPFRERLSDFLYFNDFYILAGIIILWMLVIILRH